MEVELLTVVTVVLEQVGKVIMVAVDTMVVVVIFKAVAEAVQLVQAATQEVIKAAQVAQELQTQYLARLRDSSSPWVELDSS